MAASLRLGFVLTLLISTGCAHFRIAPRDLAPASIEQQHRVHVVGWGAFESHVEPINCHGMGLASVTMRVTPLDAAAAVVTLGFWNTSTIQWTCAKERGGRRP